MRRVLGFALLMSVLAPGVAEACPVCFGDVDGPAARGVNNGILVMLAVVAVVQVGFAAMFVGIYRRGQRQASEHEAPDDARSQSLNGGDR